MAKAAPKKTVKIAGKTTKPSRGAAAAKTSKVAKQAAPVKKPAAVKAATVSKAELRAQLEKAQVTIASLRTKSREAVRGAKAAVAQIVELEAKVAQLEKKHPAQDKPAKSDSPAAKPLKQKKVRAAKKANAAVSVEADELPVAETESALED